MGRHVLLAAAVVVLDAALFIAGQQPTPPAALGYALVVALIVVVRHRSPLVAFAAALMLATLTGSAFVLLLWAAYHAGRTIISRSDTVTVVGAAVGALAVQLVMKPADPQLVSTYLVFVALPLLVGRYMAQHQRLVSALDQHNRELRWKQELLAEQERLRERLRIARDMHDSLGHRLSLVSIQAAALEVSELLATQRRAIRQLADAARGAVTELHDMVGALRTEEDPSPGMEAIETVVQEFQSAGMRITLADHGEPRPLSAIAEQAAYRVVQEGLTNAAKHAPGQPVTVNIGWESDALLVTVANPAAPPPRCEHFRVSGHSEVFTTRDGAGHGLAGLTERLRLAGGYLDHRKSGAEFRLVAMLPSMAEEIPAVGRIRTVALGLATAVLMFLAMPASMVLGVH